MKQYLKPSRLPTLTLVCGLIVFALRLWLLSLGTDAHGLLAAGSLPDLLCWIFVALTIALLALGTRQLYGAVKYSYNFPPSVSAAVGMVFAAIGFCISSFADLAAGGDTVSNISSMLGFLAAASLLVLAYCRYSGLHLNVLFHGIICLYLMVHLVAHYRLWSYAPQLQTFGFDLFAIVFIMLASYQRAAFDANRGNRRSYTFFSLTALFFCLAALPGCDNATFFIGSAVWMYTTPCRLAIPIQQEE